MVKRTFLVGITVLLLTLPLAALAANIPVRVFENGGINNPVAIPGVKIDVFGGFGFKALLSSGVSGSDGGCLLGNVPFGKEVVVKLTKPGFITQYDVRSYSETDAENGVVLWIGSEAKVEELYMNLGERFDPKKGQVYLEINNEQTGEGIEGIQFVLPSGKAFDLGDGEYLIVNADGASLRMGIQKPGYAFDIESVAIPLYPGAMTQAYVNVQTGGAVYESGQITARVTSAMITGHLLRLSDCVPVSGVTISFIRKGVKIRPDVVTDKNGFYKQTEFPVYKSVTVTPTKPPFKFAFRCKCRPSATARCPAGVKTVFVPAKGAVVDYQSF